LWNNNLTTFTTTPSLADIDYFLWRERPSGRICAMRVLVVGWGGEVVRW
jgi:hypothetical protein